MRCRLSEIKGKSPADKSRLSANLVEEEEERERRSMGNFVFIRSPEYSQKEKKTL